jgi:hypothetical protein
MRVRPALSLSASLLTLAVWACAVEGVPTGPDGETADGGPPTGADGADAEAAGDAAPADLLAPEAPSPLRLHGVSPASGPPGGGTAVTLRGAGFAPGLTVSFGHTLAPRVEVRSASEAVVVAPPHPPEVVDVTVSLPPPEAPPGGVPSRGAEPVTLPYAFEYVQALQISAVEPQEVATIGGATVTVRGEGFTAETAVIVGRGGRAEVQVLDPRTLVVLAPPQPFGAVDLHVATASEAATLEAGLRYREAPAIEALLDGGASAEPAGFRWTLYGRGLTGDTIVMVDGIETTVADAGADGRSLDFLAPDGLLTSGQAVELLAANAWGVATRRLAGPTGATGCEVTPAEGDARGGDVVAVVCPALGADAALSVGGRAARVVAHRPGSGRAAFENPGGEAGETTVTVREGGQVRATLPWRLTLPDGAARLEGLTPAEGLADGGGRAWVRGGPFAEQAVVRLGGREARAVRREADGRLSFEVPAGPPGAADLQVMQRGMTSTLRGAWTWLGDGLSLVTAAPRMVAQAGGTPVTLVGSGFGPETAVLVGGVACEVLRREGGALVVRSPRLDPGPQEVTVVAGDGTRVSRPGLIVAHDPRSGRGGAWGGPVAGVVNVTVDAEQPPGPVAGATVHVTGADGVVRVGRTDERGQATVAAGIDEALHGPVDVTAAAPGYTTASLVEVDARHVTIVLRAFPQPSSGEGPPPPTPLPTAVLSGRVIGLDKYVTAPAGSCEAARVEGIPDCQPCEPEAGPSSGSAPGSAGPSSGSAPGSAGPSSGSATGSSGPSSGSAPGSAGALACGGDPGVACVAREVDGAVARHCLRACDLRRPQCAEGYACAAAEGATGPWEGLCLPAPGERTAVCNVTIESVFGGHYAPQPTGWIDASQRYTLDSLRLGDLAVFCLGGYRHADGSFTPTVLGVRRRIFASPGAVLGGLDVRLEHPLRRTARVRVPEPPETGGLPLGAPHIALSLDLGADGAIGLSRNALPDGADATWRLTRLPTDLTGDLADGTFTLFTTLTPAAWPTDAWDHPLAFAQSHNLIVGASALTSDGLPVREAGRWRVEGTQLERDLHAVWRGEDGRLVAVGERGTVVVWTAFGWTRQAAIPGPGEAAGPTLRALVGREGALWAVGDGGAVWVWEGQAWRPMEAPAVGSDLIGAARLGETLVVGGGARLWRRPLAPVAASWELLAELPEAIAAVSEAGGVVLGAEGGVWRLEAESVTWLGRTDGRALRAATRWEALAQGPEGTRDEVIAVGDGGRVARIDRAAGGVVEVACAGAGAGSWGLSAPLTVAVATGGGEIVALGERGVALSLRWADEGTLACDVARIPRYRSRPAAAAVSGDGALRVVGSAAFDLGPFLAFPELVAWPARAPGTLAWDWTGGPAAQYTQLTLSSAFGPAAWLLTVEGAERRAWLPGLSTLVGADPLPAGTWYWDVVRVLDPRFDLDLHHSRSFHFLLRESWSSNRRQLTFEP